MPKTLNELFAEFPFAYSAFEQNPRISGIAIDSRLVKQGDLFIAVKGGSTDGHRFIASAIEKGASAIAGEDAIDASMLSVPYIRVDDTRRSITHLAAAFYDHPGRSLTVIGVTGTDGKTTTSNLLYRILITAGIKAGMISTVNAVIGDEVLDTGFHVTTPDAPDVQMYLAKMASAGLTHVVLETTSHGLAQHRVDASLYDIAVVTNITHEHLNDHGSLENYRAAKARLFQLLAETPAKNGKRTALGVLNHDDWSFGYLTEVIGKLPAEKVSTVSYGIESGAEIRAENVEYLPAGLNYEAVGKKFRIKIKSPLVGSFNVSNTLAAFTASVIGLGIDPPIAAKGIASLEGIPGRMERIDCGQNFTAIVDFAHTPNALKNAIETVRRLTNKRVIVAFGSAGLRDKQKRRMMSEIAAELADVSVLTAEDPRTESLEGILEEMAEGARSKGGLEGKTFFRVPDRGEAIRFMIKMAQAGDVIMSCGKGHEQSMCFGITEYLWDDRVAMRSALAAYMQMEGPAMPYLPTQEAA